MAFKANIQSAPIDPGIDAPRYRRMVQINAMSLENQMCETSGCCLDPIHNIGLGTACRSLEDLQKAGPNYGDDNGQ
jgi:hypothetical protein